MNCLYIRSDKPEAELYLQVNSQTLIRKWSAHRELSDTILLKIKELLDEASIDWSDINGVAVFEGPGSFTGLRIGAAVANTLSYSLGVPVVGTRDDNWLQDASDLLSGGQNHKLVTPFYGREARITKPRK